MPRLSHSVLKASRPTSFVLHLKWNNDPRLTATVCSAWPNTNCMHHNCYLNKNADEWMNNQEHKRCHGINNDKEILSCLGTAMQDDICFCRPTPTVSSLDRFFFFFWIMGIYLYTGNWIIILQWMMHSTFMGKKNATKYEGWSLTTIS